MNPSSGCSERRDAAATHGTVYVIEDDEALRAVLVRVAQSMGLTAEAFSCAEELLEVSPFATPGCIVLDLKLPGIDGLGAQRILAERGCDLPIVFLSGFGSVSSAAQALKAGAFDFLEKPLQQKKLVEILEAALACHSVTLERTRRRRAAQARLAALTPREREMIPYLVDGWISKTIAAKLGRSKKTIDLHRSNVFRKVAVSSSAALLRVVLEAEDDALLPARPDA